MEYYVYAHLNPQSKEIFYIGIGTGKRKNEFKSGRNRHYMNYIRKNGFPIIDIIKENISKEEACKIEKQLIKKYGRKRIDENGILVNKSKGGEGGNYGIKQSLETRLKKSKVMRGKIMHSSEQKEKWKIERTGRSNKWKENHIKSDKGRKKPKDFQGRGCHPIEQYSQDGVFIKFFPSIKSVTNELGIKSSNLWAHLSGKTKTAGGYTWKSKK